MTAVRRQPSGVDTRHADAVDAEGLLDPGTLATFLDVHADDIVDTWREP